MEDNNEIIIQNAIGYNFKGLTKVTFIEEIARELKLELNKYWMRPAQKSDWFTEGDWVILKQEPNPILLEEYELTYDLPYDDKTEARVKFAEFLIDSTLEYLGYIEDCLNKEEDDNKKEDTQ